MLNRLNIWLKRPYYLNLSKSFRLLVSFCFGFFTFLFLYFLTPFNLIKLDKHLLEYVFGISSIVFFSVVLVFFIPPLIFKNFFNLERWTIGKNVIYIILNLLFTSLILWFYNYKIKANYNMDSLSLGRFIYYTFIVGLFPSIFLLFINERNSRNKKINDVKEILLLKNKVKNRKPIITFTSDNDKETLKITLKDLVYITSQANYACFYIQENNVLKEYVLRITLKKIEQLLINYDEFYRCHKSFMINSNYVLSLEGNARGYQLILSFTSIKIPVSRSFPKELLKKIIK